MGFYIRKALKVGPLRFNLSKSGIGVSAGIKGLRLGTGPRGNYVHMGRGGLYFRKSLNAPGGPKTPPRSIPPSLPPTPTHPGEPPGTVGPMEGIDSASVSDMVDASSLELLKELNEKRKKIRLLPVAMILSGAVFLALLAAGVSTALLAFLAVLALTACWWLSMKDALRKTTVILYDLEPAVERAYEQLHEAFGHLSSCARIWHIGAKGQVRDRKYHAGAGAVVTRKQVSLRKGAPPFVKTNVEVPLVPAGSQTLGFMPDRLLVFEANAVGVVSYGALTLDRKESQFVEDEAVPSDATVVGKTWRYVNKKGGPDRRFKDNPEIPICAYEQLHFSSRTGLNEVIQLSRRAAGEAFEAALSSMQELKTDDTRTPAV